ncbi:hypothetical protein [uncultured Ruminococcus sp.]|uniref:hypothetical protein n=1 Tax=uncultured Ruminococcus sp. TaxID=165186 RepID=UPI0025FD4907|nr:hypothetical protein [uncultured Ruminococcus sp.]
MPALDKVGTPIYTNCRRSTLSGARELSQLDTAFYSGHCTGIPAFEMMKEIMGEKLTALHSGETVL